LPQANRREPLIQAKSTRSTNQVDIPLQLQDEVRRSRPRLPAAGEEKVVVVVVAEWFHEGL
jgi:hypothetical protein